MAVKKLGLDLGNSVIKIAAKTEDNRVILAHIDSAFDIRSGSVAPINDKGSIVSCNDTTIFLGEGMPLNAVDKTKRQHFEHQVLYAVWRAFGSGSHVVKLAIGLPIKPFKAKGQSYEEQLSSLIKIQGKVNNEPVTVNVDSIKVCAEGYSSLYSLDEKISQMSPTLIVDIGYKTTDALSVRWDESQGIFNPERFDSVEIGLYDFFELISERLLTEGADVSPEEINKRLYSPSSIVRTESGVCNLRTSLNLASEKYAQLINRLEIKFGQLMQYDLLFTGGGSKVFLDGIEEGKLQNIKEITDEQKYYSNALGYLEQISEED